jgi:hypothetical protein
VASGRRSAAAHPGPSARPARRGRVAAVLFAAALAVIATGCATVPAGGPPRPLTGQGGQPQAFVQPLPPPPPQPGWSAQQVVEGFLHASASFALDPRAAEKYLAPGVKWRPGSVTVVSSVTLGPSVGPRLNVTPPTESVQVSGERLASLSNSGQYTTEPGTTSTYTFTLAKYGGVWLISSLPRASRNSAASPLLLYQADFEQVFQPRNLYFLAGQTWPGNRLLVPDPVYVPLQANNSALTTNLARILVKGLLSGAGSWLADPATWNAFPLQTRLLGVSISDATATVDIGGPAVYDADWQKRAMYAQLRQTLASNAYSPPVATYVRLEFDGRPLRVGPVSGQLPAIPAVGSGSEPVYFANGGTVQELRPGVKGISAVTGAPQGLAGISAVAASGRTFPASSGELPGLAVAVADGSGCSVQVRMPGRQTSFRTYRLSSGGGSCTSLSWDQRDDVWAAAGSRIWVIEPSAGAVQVSLPAMSQPALRVLSLRIAPDAVRAAMLVQTSKTATTVVLAAIDRSGASVIFGPGVPVGTSLADPAAVSWYTANDLAVLSRSELWEVPLTGGSPQLLGSAPAGATSMATAGYGFAVGTTGGQILTSPTMDSQWTQMGPGMYPAYPG